MHDIWNPWHGCTKVSEGCAHCYMFSQDAARGLDGAQVRRNKGGFAYPLARRRDGTYKVRSGELIRVCMTSDFFVEESDPWRDEVWDIIHARPDVRFFILTKRPERMREHLPADWGAGWENVMLNVTCENQRRADERIPILLATPARHKGVMCAPFIGRVDLERYLAAGDAAARGGGAAAVGPEGDGRGGDGPDATSTAGLVVRGCGIEQVIAGGENYEGARPCDFDWVRLLSRQCRAHDVTFAFIETGSVFVKDGRTYRLPGKTLQAEQAYRAGVQHRGREIAWRLTDPIGLAIPPEELYVRRFRARCARCGSRLICNGCANCGLCGEGPRELVEEDELERRAFGAV